MHDENIQTDAADNAGSDVARSDNAAADVTSSAKPVEYLEPESNLFKVTRILVDLDFTATDPATRLQFECAIAQNQAAAELRQTFYAQPTAAITRDAEFAFFLGYLALVVKMVRGVPETVGGVSGERFADMLREVGPAEDAFAFEIASSFFDQYIRKTKPKQFFR